MELQLNNDLISIDMNKMFERKIQLKNKEINLKIIIIFMYLRKILIWNE